MQTRAVSDCTLLMQEPKATEHTAIVLANTSMFMCMFVSNHVCGSTWALHREKSIYDLFAAAPLPNGPTEGSWRCGRCQGLRAGVRVTHLPWMSLNPSVCQLSAQEFGVTFVCFPKPHSSLQNACCSIKKSQGLFHVHAFKTLTLILHSPSCFS